MKYRSAEDRLNPIAAEAVDESTLGGYPRLHGRAAAFEGVDGRPYTAAIDAEPAGDGDGWVGYLVFVLWADTGTAIMGHLETPDLVSGPTEQDVRAQLEALPLARVKEILDATIASRRSEEVEP